MAMVNRTAPTVGECPWPCLKLGMEFEGSWCFQDTRSETAYAANRMRYVAMGNSGKYLRHGDGSVGPAEGRWDYTGEWITNPLIGWGLVVEAIVEAYPDGINDSCGFHIHTSWAPGNYSRLADTAFWEYFRSYWAGVIAAPPPSFSDEDMRRLKKRYAGNDGQYCKVQHTPGAQMQGGGDRYTQLNYCYKKHKTIECRMLPKFESLQAAVDAVRLLLLCYSTYLERPDGVEEAVTLGTVNLDEPVTEEVQELLSMTIPERVIVRDLVDVVELRDVEVEYISDTVDTTQLDDTAPVHEDFLRRAPSGSFKMLELGAQEPRAVRDRVKAFLRKLGAESDE